MINNVITASRLSTLVRCPRKHYWQYEIGLQRKDPGKALQFGRIWHYGMEKYWAGEAWDGKQVEESLLASIMLACYYRYYGGKRTDSYRTEWEFRYTHRDKYQLAGKIDAFKPTEPGHLVECKTTGSSLESDSQYWLRLRYDIQLLQYVCAIRAQFNFTPYVVYDVMRKPLLRQKKAESEADYLLRLDEDVNSRPGFYFFRREVHILEDEIVTFEKERDKLIDLIEYYRQIDFWPRSVSTQNCSFCPFADFCLQNINIDIKHPPDQYVIKLNPELGDKLEDKNITTEDAIAGGSSVQ